LESENRLNEENLDPNEENEEGDNLDFINVKCPYWLELIIVYGVFFLIIYIGNSFKNIKIVKIIYIKILTN
jgi:hypothetical protein